LFVSDDAAIAGRSAKSSWWGGTERNARARWLFTISVGFEASPSSTLYFTTMTSEMHSSDEMTTFLPGRGRERCGSHCFIISPVQKSKLSINISFR